MTIHVRAKEAVPSLGIRRGEDAAVSGDDARVLHALGKVWITGGDAADFAAHGLAADADAGPPIAYPLGGTMQADIIPAAQEG